MASFRESKIIRLLGSLSTEEYKSLGKWLQSPWCNSTKKLYRFYQILQPFHPDFSARQLDKTWLYKKLFDKRAYNASQLNNLIRKFVAQVNNFLVHNALDTNQIQKQSLLIQAYAKGRQDEYFVTECLGLIKELEAISPKPADYYLLLSSLFSSLYYHPSQSIKYQSDAPHLALAIEYLDQYYLISKYRFLHETNTRRKLVNKLEPSVEEWPMLEHLYAKYDIPELALYHQRLGDTSRWTFEQLNDFFDQYQQWRSYLPFREQQIFFFACVNDCIRLITAGEDRAYKKMLDIYRFGFEQNLLSLEGGQITRELYTNFVQIASIHDEFDLADRFIANYTLALPDNIRQQAERWAIGQLHYRKGAFQQAIDQLDFTFEDKIYAIQARVTLLKARYDLFLQDDTQYRSFQSYGDAFKKYIQRQTVYSEKRKPAYHNLIFYTQKLAQLQGLSTTDKLEEMKRLEQKIKQTSPLFGRRWLKEKIEQAINRNDP